MPPLTLMGSDQPPSRAVVLAVELWDPVTTLPVSAGISVTVKLKGRDAKPAVTAFGRFAWLGDPDVWPSEISVDPGKQPYKPIEKRDLTAAEPPQWPKVTPRDRLIRIQLTPTTAYQFADGVSALSGYLYEPSTTVPNSRDAIANADVWFEWYDTGGSGWTAIDPSLRVKTDAQGQFGVFARIPRSMGHLPDVEKGLLRIQVGVTRAGVTRHTPVNFQFLPPPAAATRVPEGLALGDWVALDWTALV